MWGNNNALNIKELQGFGAICGANIPLFLSKKNLKILFFPIVINIVIN